MKMTKSEEERVAFAFLLASLMRDHQTDTVRTLKISLEEDLAPLYTHIEVRRGKELYNIHSYIFKNPRWEWAQRDEYGLSPIPE